MTLPQWTVRSGSIYNFGVNNINERSSVSIPLPLASTESITVKVIAGELPPGLRIEDYKIKGTPFEVSRTTDFEFTIRASTTAGISDRTFSLTIDGYDAPQWQTPEGALSISTVPSGQYWLDIVNTKWGLFATNAGSSFIEQSVIVYEGIPSSEQGANGDYAFVLEQSHFWFKANDRWHKFTRNNIQRELGIDQEIQVGKTVPNPNLIDFWFNTNKFNNGTDIRLRQFDSNTSNWVSVEYIISQAAPITPVDQTVWIQTFENSFNFSIKKFNSTENNWEILKFDYSAVPPNRKSRAYFILDNSLVDFQLQALDTDLATGASLEYYIADGDGELPPGLTLEKNGKISGIVDPLLALDQNVDPGYDIGRYDAGLFDFGIKDDFGYDSYFYDTTVYDLSQATRRPKKLNRRYQFAVTVADDVGESKRIFNIYVVGDDFVRADNTIMQAGTGIFTADNTYLRNPVWLTPGNLGVRRANNYVTLYLDVYDPNSLIGTVSYILKEYNDDGTRSTLPPGLEIDSVTGEVAGRVPYQPAVSKDYRFTVEALRQEGDYDIEDEFVATIYEDTLPGRSEIKVVKQVFVDENTQDITVLIGKDILIDQNRYNILSIDKSNKDFDLIKLDRPLQPVGNVKALKVLSDAVIGDDGFYISLDSLNTESQRVFWREKTLNYSSTESYKISQLQEYVSLSVSNADSSVLPLEFNYQAAESVISYPSSPEQPFEALQRYISAQLTSLGVDPSFYNIDITPNDDGSIINIIVPAFPLTRNRNLIKELFHFGDSSGVEVVYGNSEISDALFYRAVLDKTLSRNISKNSQISIGALKDTTIRQRLTVANVETVSTSKTFTVKLLGEVESTINWITPELLPNMVANRVSYLRLEAETSVVGANLKYNLISGQLPFGLELKSDGEVVGKANQFSTVQVNYKGFYKNDRTYYLNDLVRSENTYYRCIQTYTAGVYYQLTNTEYWEEYTLTNENRGLTFFDRKYNTWLAGISYTIGNVVEYGDVNYVCVADHISASSSQDANRPDYDVANTYWQILNTTTVFDGSTTKFDRLFKFTVIARDRFGFSATTRTFTLSLVDVDNKVYSNVYMQPFIEPAKRTVFDSFINDYGIFTPQYIYRPSDPNFGIQKNLRTLAYAGIEQKSINSFVAAAALNHRKKQFKFGEIKTAVARQPGTNDVIYEVVYVDLKDPQEPLNGKTKLKYDIKTKNNLKINQVKLEIKDDNSAQEVGLDFFRIAGRLEIVQIRSSNNTLSVVTRSAENVIVPAAGTFEILGNNGSVTVIRSQGSATSSTAASERYRPTAPVVTADSNAYKVSQNKDDVRYISNISNMRQRISEIGVNEREYLPLWMRTSQDGNIEEIDYVTAMPLCFCKPGTGELIKENIINNGFNFNQINYEIDRYIIDSTSDNQREQFVLFANYKFNV